MSSSGFDDLLAAVALYVDAWKNPAEADGVTDAFRMLEEQCDGISRFTSKERERIFRDAAIREAARRGERQNRIANRYGLDQSRVSAIALGGGIRRRASS
jgi:hypothetical protein